MTKLDLEMIHSTWLSHSCSSYLLPLGRTATHRTMISPVALAGTQREIPFKNRTLFSPASTAKKEDVTWKQDSHYALP
jgi:hypothetical protein